MNQPNFWNDKRNSEKIINELNDLKNKVEKVSELKQKINDNFDIIKELRNTNDNELKELIEISY